MLCEQANPLLVEYGSGELSAQVALEVEQHLAHCTDCQQEFTAISNIANLAREWHDEVPAAWHPPQIEGRDWRESFRQWFPSFASAAALAMVGLLYIQMPGTNGTLPTGSTPAGDYQTLPELPKATQAAMVEQVMENSREQRQEELQALLKILKAEMDRRSIETEESLRYVITHQIQGQQELDELYSQVDAMMEQSPDGNPGSAREISQ